MDVFLSVVYMSQRFYKTRPIDKNCAGCFHYNGVVSFYLEFLGDSYNNIDILN